MKEQKIAVVIGGSRGIGFAIAQKLARNNYRVIITGKSKSNLNNALMNAKKSNLNLEIYSMDATKESDVEDFFEYIKSIGVLHVCVNCVGKNLSQKFVYENSEGRIIKHELNKWNQTILINQTSVFLCCREASSLMIMQKNKGVIVNIATSLWKGAYAQCAYTAAKAAVVSLTRTIAVELSRYGIRCMAVAPGAVNGEALNKACADNKKHKNYMDRLESQVPLKRFAEEEEVADTVLFCVNNNYMTGKVIELDGGGFPEKVIFTV